MVKRLVNNHYNKLKHFIMKSKFFFLSCAFIPLFFSVAGCTYDDTEIRDKVDDLDRRT